MAVNSGVVLWQIDGNPMEEFILAIRRLRLPAIEDHVLGLTDGIVDRAYPPHSGIKVGAIGTGIGPL